MVNKSCFKKSIVHDFVWILLVIVALAISGLIYLILIVLALILAPLGTAYNWVIVLALILAPLGTAYNWVIVLSILTMLVLLVIPLFCSPSEMIGLPTSILLVIDYMIGGMFYILYNLFSCHYTGGYATDCTGFPDITLFIIGAAIVFTIICPISMGYARCRGE